MTESQDALAAAIRAEHAAVYLYGVIEAYAASSRRADTAKYVAAHRAQRDALAAALTAAKASVPEAAVAYTPPSPITDPASAVTVAAAVEDDCAAAHHNLLARADSDELRRLGLTGLGDSAVRGGHWRAILAVSPITPALPGTSN